MPVIETEFVETNQLRVYPGNPRRGDLEAIKESMRRLGQYRPIVANRRTSEVLAGNHVLLAARELRLERLAVAFIEVDDEQAKRIVAGETRPGELYALGEHRLVCGDARKRADLGRVCDRPAKLLLTDPPYGVDYQGK